MNIKRLSGFAFAFVLVVFAGCGGGNDMIEPPQGAQVAVAIVPGTVAAEEPVLFTVSAHDAGAAIQTISIDYTGDGTWDQTLDFDENDVDAEFTYIYTLAATYVVKIEVRNANDVPTQKSVTLAVGPARNVPVSYVMIGSSVQGGTCSAQGAPACPSCGVTLTGDPATSARRPMGMFSHGASAAVSQGFGQFPYVSGQDVYACSYELRLTSGTGPLELPFATGRCTTNSALTPAYLSCNITVSGTVP